MDNIAKNNNTTMADRQKDVFDRIYVSEHHMITMCPNVCPNKAALIHALDQLIPDDATNISFDNDLEEDPAILTISYETHQLENDLQYSDRMRSIHEGQLKVQKQIEEEYSQYLKLKNKFENV